MSRSSQNNTLTRFTRTSDAISHVSSLEDDFEPRIVISVDYGTTYTGVAWILTTNQNPKLSDVKVVSKWPGGVTEPKVPSTYTYSSHAGRYRWGHKIGKNSLVIRWTKLDIELPSLEKALGSLKQTVSEAGQLNFNTNPRARDRNIPYHLTHSSEDIITDYLSQVLAHARLDIKARQGEEQLSEHPIDLVITHPAVWDSRARNITFRAATTAFSRAFRGIDYKLEKVQLGTEPEACAQYLIREARERGGESAMSTLQPGSCFIVVDAGGGTADLVSYLVEEVDPLQVRKLTTVSGDKFGATLVDDFFLKKTLPRRLKPDELQRLLAMGETDDAPGGGSHVVLREGEQEMLGRFLPIKHAFAGRSEVDDEEPLDERLQLPTGLGIANSESRNIVNGELILTCDDMEEMFDEPVNGIISLLDKQLTQINGLRMGTRCETILLSGGFSKNEYLRRRINDFARGSNMALIYDSDRHATQPNYSGSWTAVAKGAVLMSLGMGCDPLPSSASCPLFIGVVASSEFKLHEHKKEHKYTDSFSRASRARDYIHWLVRKNDLISANEGIEASVRIVRSFRGNKSGTVKIVTTKKDYGYGVSLQELTQSPDRAGFRTYELKYDLNDATNSHFRTIKSTNPKSKDTYQQVDLRVEIFVSKDAARVQLVLGRERALSREPLDATFIPFSNGGAMSETIRSLV